MKNSIIMIIIIISTLTFYSCSDEDEVKTEPEKSIEDCLELIQNIQNNYYINESINYNTGLDYIKLDTCSFEYIGNIVQFESVFFYVDRGEFKTKLQNQQQLFNNNDSLQYTEDINNYYSDIKDILQNLEKNSDCILTFHLVKGRESTYNFNTNKYVINDSLDIYNQKLESLNSSIRTDVPQLFIFETKLNTIWGKN